MTTKPSNRAAVALVTGANKGIGWEISRALGERGFFVLAAGRSPTRIESAVLELHAHGVSASPIVLDVTDGETIREAAEAVDRDWGHLDALVNNAGVLLEPIGVGTTPSSTAIELVERTYDTNVLGAIRVTNAMIQLLLKAKAPRVVNVTSWLASLAGEAPQGEKAKLLNLLGYNSSKTALNAATVAYAKEFEGTALKVNAVNPGHCATDINGHTGDRSARQAAALPVWAATLPADGPSGQFLSGDGVLPW